MFVEQVEFEFRTVSHYEVLDDKCEVRRRKVYVITDTSLVKKRFSPMEREEDSERLRKLHFPRKIL